MATLNNSNFLSSRVGHKQVWRFLRWHLSTELKGVVIGAPIAPAPVMPEPEEEGSFFADDKYNPVLLVCSRNHFQMRRWFGDLLEGRNCYNFRWAGHSEREYSPRIC